MKLPGRNFCMLKYLEKGRIGQQMHLTPYPTLILGRPLVPGVLPFNPSSRTANPIISSQSPPPPQGHRQALSLSTKPPYQSHRTNYAYIITDQHPTLETPPSLNLRHLPSPNLCNLRGRSTGHACCVVCMYVCRCCTLKRTCNNTTNSSSKF